MAVGATEAAIVAPSDTMSVRSIRQRLASLHVDRILADTCELGAIFLALALPDGDVLIRAGDSDLARVGQPAQAEVSVRGQRIATLIGYGPEPRLDQLVQLTARRIEDRLADDEEIDSLASEIVHTYEALHVLYNLTATLGGVLDIKAIGAVIVESILMPLDALHVEVTLFDDGNGRPLASHTRELAEGMPIAANAAAHAPLIVNGEQIGVIAVRGKVQDIDFSSADLKLLDSVAILAASALQHARLHGRELELRDRVRMDIAAAPLDSSALLQRVAESLATTFGYTLVECWLVEDGEIQLKGRHGSSTLRDLSARPSQLCRQVLSEGTAILMEEATETIDQAPEVHSQLCVPLSYGEQTTGVIRVADQLPLSYVDLRLIESIAMQVSLAIEKTWLLEEVKRTHAGLVQASKLAAIGTLAAGVAHEFNNLLAGMQGYAELGRYDRADKDEVLDVVLRGCQRGTEITRGLLTFARPTDGKRELVQMASIADEALRLLARDLDRANIQVERIYETPGLVRGDSTQLMQVIFNLLTNARDAMLTSGGMLALQITDEPRGVVVRVRDTGCGIPAEMLGRLFEPFMTSKGALGGGNLGGTGLGLAVSYSIITAHGGTIEVESRVGAGSCFMLILPHSDTTAAQSSASHRLPGTPKSRQSLRILVAEDDADVRAVLSTILRRAGHSVEQVEDGAAALDRCQPGAWDVIVTDLTMPRLDGRSLIAYLRAQDDPTPVIVITGHGDSAAVEMIYATGADRVLLKPFTAEEVLGAIDDLCARTSV